MNWYEVLDKGKTLELLPVSKLNVDAIACTKDNLKAFQLRRLSAIQKLESLGNELEIHDYSKIKAIANYVELYACATNEIERYLYETTLSDDKQLNKRRNSWKNQQIQKGIETAIAWSS